MTAARVAPANPVAGGPGGHGAAYDTLHRGTRFLMTLATGLHPMTAPTGDAGHRVRARYLGNCLRELDRFLHILMDDVTGPRTGTGPAMGPIAVAPPVSLSLGQTTAGKLGGHAGGSRDLAADQARLRALARSRLCLSHGDGRARHPDRRDGDRMTAGWFAPASTRLRRYRIGERLSPSPHDLAGVSAFYLRLADQIVGIAPVGRPVLVAGGRVPTRAGAHVTVSAHTGSACQTAR